MARRSEWGRLFRAVEQAGWRVRRTRHGWLAWPPAGPPVNLCRTPSDVRAVRNTTAALRRAGLAV